MIPELENNYLLPEIYGHIFHDYLIENCEKGQNFRCEVFVVSGTYFPIVYVSVQVNDEPCYGLLLFVQNIKKEDRRSFILY